MSASRFPETACSAIIGDEFASHMGNVGSLESDAMQRDLIYDVGMHTGKDTGFYLAKGFRVIAIEANSTLANQCKDKFADHIEQGRLQIIEAAISDSDGELEFFVCHENDDWSTADPQVLHRKMASGATFHSTIVPCRRFDEIVQQYGVPYYMKIDVEGADLFCLDALSRIKDRPLYVSAELTEEHPYEELFQLYVLGYRKFKLINQAMNVSVKLPKPAREGIYVERNFDGHTSGPFGEETPGSWIKIEDAFAANRKILKLYKLDRSRFIDRVRIKAHRIWSNEPTGWHDIHAKLED